MHEFTPDGKPDCLWTLRDIVENYGVSKATVTYWSYEAWFPMPVGKRGVANAYRKSEVVLAVKAQEGREHSKDGGGQGKGKRHKEVLP